VGVEIERRFRVNLERLAPNGEDGKMLRNGVWMRQAYIALNPSIRVRLMSATSLPVDATTTGVKAVLTVKGKGTLVRKEFEIGLDPTTAHGLMGMAEYGQVTKLRRRLPVNHSMWELDQFLGPHAGLWLAEIELPSEDAPFSKPPWLGEEVTEDHRFGNAYLANHPEDRFWA
jgi:adenylate cyclase